MKHYHLMSAVLGLSLPLAAAAHHAFSPVYDGDRRISIRGTVLEFKYVNPHAMITIDVVDDSGVSVEWSIEMAGVLSISRHGWSETTVKPGDQVTVTGNPMHSGAPGVFLRGIVLPDGSELLDPGDAARSSIEEQRRQRALERSSSTDTN